jgi:8-amino-7-oxononanoate synthase
MRFASQGGGKRRGPLAYPRRAAFCNFSSNDYLGLSQHPAIIRAWQQGAERFGVGSGGSGHVSGYTTAHQALEEALADWLGYPRALLFISGFAANQAVITALMGKRIALSPTA